MDSKNKIIEEYYNYLGLKNNSQDMYNQIIIISSINRKKLINKYYYPIIISFVNSNIIISVTPEYYLEFKEYFSKAKFNLYNEENLKNLLNNFFESKLLKFRINKMIRMYKIKESDIDTSEVIEITQKVKEHYMNSFVINNDISYKEEKWENLKSKAVSGTMYGLIYDNKIASLGYVSDVICNFSNIVIQTLDSYRNKGFGKKVVEKISLECFKKAILPIYWVNEQNIASIKLAKSLNFKDLSSELVVLLLEN